MVYIVRFILNLFWHLYITVNATVLIRSVWVLNDDACKPQYKLANNGIKYIVGWASGAFISGKLYTALHAIAYYVNGFGTYTTDDGKIAPKSIQIIQTPPPRDVSYALQVNDI